MATVIKKRGCGCKDRARCGHRPWAVRLWVDGKQKERSFRTKGEASAYALTAEQSKRDDSFIDHRDGRIIFVDYAARWIDGLDRAAGTKSSYRSVLSAQIRPVLGSRTLAQVAADREAVQNLIAGMTGSASRKSTCLTVITGAINEAVTAGKIGRHRLGGLSVRADAQGSAQIIPATNAQLDKLAGGIRPDLALTVWIMRGCGLRISECLAVSLANFRDGGRTLRVCEQVARDGSLAPLKARKVNEHRDCPVPAWLWAKVQAHVAEFGTDGGYLFGKGKRVRYAAYHDRFAAAAKKAGLGEDFTEHQLRHQFVSVLLAAGVPLTDVATFVGHRDIRVTFKIYGHLVPSAWDRSRDALESLAA